MNYTPDVGWYYRSLYDRAAAWTGVEYIYKFLINNESVGPYAHEVSQNEVMPGDILQLGDADGHFFHTPVIIATSPTILTAAHTYDALDKPLSAYNSDIIRFLHIDGVRTW